MYSSKQVEHLFDLVEALKASPDQGSEAFSNLCAEVDRLKALNQILMMGTHHERKGESHYLYLVPKNRPFGEVEFERHLEAEVQDDEFLQVDTMDSPVVID